MSRSIDRAITWELPEEPPDAQAKGLLEPDGTRHVIAETRVASLRSTVLVKQAGWYRGAREGVVPVQEVQLVSPLFEAH